MSAVKETIGTCTIYQGDSYEILPTLIGQYDTLCFDPPYDFDTQGGGKLRKSRQNMEQISEYNLNNGFDLSILDMNGENTRSVVSFAHNNQLPEILNKLNNDFEKFCLCNWDKTNPMPVANKSYQPNLEHYVHAWNKDVHPLGTLEELSRTYRGACGKSEFNHPTVKPEALMRKIITNINSSVAICDPFMGSGTCGVICQRMGKNFIGIEKIPEFFEIACERIYKEFQEPDLFVINEKQNSLFLKI